MLDQRSPTGTPEGKGVAQTIGPRLWWLIAWGAPTAALIYGFLVQSMFQNVVGVRMALIGHPVNLPGVTEVPLRTLQAYAALTGAVLLMRALGIASVNGGRATVLVIGAVGLLHFWSLSAWAGALFGRLLEYEILVNADDLDVDQLHEILGTEAEGW